MWSVNTYILFSYRPSWTVLYRILYNRPYALY